MSGFIEKLWESFSPEDQKRILRETAEELEWAKQNFRVGQVITIKKPERYANGSR